ncbi:MAG: metallophosphoesterase, partial [Actinomycetota bacterium]|nr:metallophosphoesterase [Actinomycetota bacterium]
MEDYVRLVVSDVHMGSLYSKESKLHRLFHSTHFDEIILAGDIVDFIKIPSFTEHSAQLFQDIAQFNKEGKKIIYVVGNHDIAFRKFIGQTVAGIQFVENYEFEYGNRKYRIEH